MHQRDVHGMASRDRVEAGHHATGSNAGNPSASRPSPPPSRTGIPRTPSDETASLHSVRKRASFFGRSNSDASSMRRGVASSHAAKSSFSGIRVEGDVIRPTTAASGEMRRRKTDPLQSIRDSIFGGKKKGAADGSSSRPGSRGTETLPHDLTPLPSSFSSEEECEDGCCLRDKARH